MAQSAFMMVSIADLPTKKKKSALKQLVHKSLLIQS
jgi:hypothetical protein